MRNNKAARRRNRPEDRRRPKGGSEGHLLQTFPAPPDAERREEPDTTLKPSSWSRRGGCRQDRRQHRINPATRGRAQLCGDGVETAWRRRGDEEVSQTNRLHMNDNEAENWCERENRQQPMKAEQYCMRALKYAGRQRDGERGRTPPSPIGSVAESQSQNKSSEWTTGVKDEFPTIFRLFPPFCLPQPLTICLSGSRLPLLRLNAKLAVANSHLEREGSGGGIQTVIYCFMHFG